MKVVGTENDSAQSERERDAGRVELLGGIYEVPSLDWTSRVGIVSFFHSRTLAQVLKLSQDPMEM